MINEFLISIINFFYRIVPNYGVAIILFTIVIKAALSPLDLKSRRSMRRMNELKPKMDALQKKYANDKEKLNQKMSELYKAEKANPLSGCLPMLLSLPILFFMFAAMRHIANQQLVEQFLQLINGVEPAREPFLWIKNLWMPDNFSFSIMPDYNALRAITDVNIWNAGIQSIMQKGILTADVLPQLASKEALTAYIATIPDLIAGAPLYQQYLATIPGWTNINMLLFRVSVFVQVNGYFILPVLAMVTQALSSKFMNPQQTAAPATGPDGKPAPNPGKTMMMMMPLMSLFFCMTYSSAFALYWVMSNVIATVQQVAFNRYFEWQDRKASVAGEVGIK